MGVFVRDLRYAVRTFLNAPGFTAVAVLTLALGIGANSAIFTVINGVLIKPLGYPEPDRLVFIYSAFPALEIDAGPVSHAEYRELQERSRSFSVIGAWQVGEASLSGIDTPVRVTRASASAELFAVFGVSPQLGHVYTREQETSGGPATVLLSDRLWRDAFGADPGIVGREIEVNGVRSVVSGVMPAGFDVAARQASWGEPVASNIDVWMPAGIPDEPLARTDHRDRLVARLAPGVTLEAARADIARLVAVWRAVNSGEHAPDETNHPLRITSVRKELVADIRPALMILLGAVGLVLLIACANVANLLLVKAESRQVEIALRAALGVPPRRLGRLFLTEGVVLALAGGVAGLLLGWWSLNALLAASPNSLPRTGAIGLDPVVLTFTFGVAGLAGLLFGLAPLLQLSPGTMYAALRDGGQRSSGSIRRQRLRRLLVIAEVAIAVILVIGSGLLIRSFTTLRGVEPGFDAAGLVTFGLHLPEAKYSSGADQVAFVDRLHRELEALNDVQGVATMRWLPPLREAQFWDTEFEGIEPTEDGPWHNVDYYQFVTTDFFETMRTPIVRGRAFQASDDGASTPVAIINETLARVFYPDVDPIGRRVRPDDGTGRWFTIVGVARDVKQGGLAAESSTELYYHYPQRLMLGEHERSEEASEPGPATPPPADQGLEGTRNIYVAVRATGDPPAHFAAVRRAVANVDAALPLSNLQTMEANIAGSVSRERFLTLLLAIFAGIALALAAVGTYGVLSYSVAKRTREIGIRMAMGAGEERVMAMVLRDGLKLTAVGLALGIIGALGLTRLLSSLLFGVSSTDPTTFVLAPATLALVALAACYVPARRAMRVEPMVALRAE